MSIFEAVVLEAEVNRLRAENSELRAMIKQLEWTRWRFSWFSDLPETCCPICGRQQRLGHAPDCKLAVLLGR